MKLQLPSSISSRQDVDALLLDIHAYARWFAHAAVKKHLRVKATAEPPIISSGANELIRDWVVKKPLSVSSLDELIRALEAFRDHAPSLTITLAAPAPAGLRKTLVEWCRKHISPDMLVNFEFNSTLLGGMVVRSGSHIFDWSFRRQILEQRSRFPEVLKHVR